MHTHKHLMSAHVAMLIETRLHKFYNLFITLFVRENLFAYFKYNAGLTVNKIFRPNSFFCILSKSYGSKLIIILN